MSYTRFMDRSLDEMAADMRHPRGDDRESNGDSDDRTLFVANLNYSTSWQELRDHLRKAGPIERCDIFRDANGYSKGFGLVVFGDIESAERALHEYNDSILNSRNMKLRKARSSGDRDKEYLGDSSSRRGRPRQDPAATVFVHNLDYSVTWQKLKDIFKVVGRVIDVEVLEGRKGAAVVQFSNSDDAIKAIALFHGQMLMDRPMQLRMDSKSPYQPDPLKLKLSTVQGNHHPRQEHHSRHDQHSRQEHHSSREHHSRHGYQPRHEHHSHPHSRSRSPYPPPLRRERDYTPDYSPPPRYGSGYDREPSKREESYYPVPRDTDSHYSKPEKSYPERSRGYERSEHQYSMRSRSRSRSQERGRNFSPDWREQDQRYITSVFVKNLPFSTTWQTLKDEFRKAGLVKRAEIKMNKEGRPSGLALVFYDSHKDACNAVSMFDDTNFDGRHINVQLNKMHPRQQRY